MVPVDGDRSGPAILSHRATRRPAAWLLPVVLEDLGIAHPDIVRVETELPPGPALAQQVPALIQGVLQLAQPPGFGGLERASSVMGAQLMLLGQRPVDDFVDLVVVHRYPFLTWAPDRGA